MAHTAPLPRGAGSRGPRSRPPLAWPGPEAAPHGLGLARGAGTGARSDMGKKHKKHKSDKHLYEGEELGPGGDGEPTATLWAFRAFDTTPERPKRTCGRTSHEQARTRGGGAARWRRRRPPGGVGVGTWDPWPWVGLSMGGVRWPREAWERSGHPFGKCPSFNRCPGSPGASAPSLCPALPRRCGS